jgi:hypothetical protein
MADLVADAKKRPGHITFGITLGSTTLELYEPTKYSPLTLRSCD